MRMVGAETLVVTNAVGSINPQYQVLTILQVGPQYQVLTNTVPGIVNPQYPQYLGIGIVPGIKQYQPTQPGSVNQTNQIPKPPQIVPTNVVVCSLKGRQQEICKRLIVAMIIQVGDIMLVCDHINMFGLAGNSPLR